MYLRIWHMLAFPNVQTPLSKGKGKVPAHSFSTMKLGEAKVNGDGLGVSKMEISIGFGGESGDDGLGRALLEHVGEETLLEHLLRINVAQVVGLGRRGRLLLRWLGFVGLVGALLGVFGLAGSLLLALLQLVPRHHLTRLIVENELDSSLRDLIHWVRHDVFCLARKSEKVGG